MQDNNQSSIEQAIDCLKSGGVLLYLSDTIWGLGCDAGNLDAVQKIFKIKNRDTSKPLISLVSDLQMLKQHTPSLHPRIETLPSFHERPLTIVHPDVSGIVYPAKDLSGKAAIRIATIEPLNSIIDQLGSAVTSTSANLSGAPFPTCFDDVSDVIKERVDYILRTPDYDNPKQPSSVITYDEKGELIVLRE